MRAIVQDQDALTTPGELFNIHVYAEDPNNPVLQNQVRLFINLGRHQGMRTADLLEFVQNETGMDRADVQRVHVRSSYGFFNVPSEAADNVIDKLSGTTYKEREVRVERAKSSEND